MANGCVEREQVARGEESVEGGVTEVHWSKAMVTVGSYDKAVCRGRRGDEVKEVLLTRGNKGREQGWVVWG